MKVKEKQNKKGLFAERGGSKANAGTGAKKNNQASTKVDAGGETMRSLSKGYRDLIFSDIQTGAADWDKTQEYLKNSTAVFARGHLNMLAVPKLFPISVFEYINEVAATVSEILDKVIRNYEADPDYRKLFPFSKELEELILLPAGYERRLPIARVDLFLNEEDLSFKFCEFNADGASAMNEDREIFNAIKGTEVFKAFSEKYKVTAFELFDSWVDEFLEIYSGYHEKKEDPCVAIVDFLESGTGSEFKVFKKAFEKRGLKTVIAEIRDLKFENGMLLDAAGNKIDVVYRRAVTSECMENYAEITPFLDAVRADAVCLIGAFRTQVIHHKMTFNILRHEKTKAFLTEKENSFVEEHIPKTYRLAPEDIDLKQILENKDKWLIKPMDRYGSKGVVAGADCTKKEWEREVLSNMKEGFVVQEFCSPYSAPNLYFENGNPQPANYNNMTGLFLYNKKLKGLYSRQMLTRVTTTRNEGRVACSLVCERRG